MLKKILFLGLIISIAVNFNYVSAETSLIIPLKKPSLTDKEIKKKIDKCTALSLIKLRAAIFGIVEAGTILI